MKKVFVINELFSVLPTTCCNFIKRVNDFEATKSAKLFFEESLTGKFNSIASKGFEFEDNNIFFHNLYVENKKTDETRSHGVFRFKDSTKNAQYKVYFGPLIEVSKKGGCSEIGCKGVGCKGVGCKGVGCKGIGCNNIGCSSKGGDEKQYLNFRNDEKNIEEVRYLNKFFGLRRLFNKETDDYLYAADAERVTLSEIVKEQKDFIIQCFEEDMKSFQGQGFGYDKLIDMPSENDMFTQAMLFSNLSSVQIEIEDPTVSFQIDKNTYLSRFDLWYFPLAQGLLRRIINFIINFLLKIITLGLHKGKQSTIENFTSVIEDDNILQLEKIYEDDFNQQEQFRKENPNFFGNSVGKIPVTIAIRHKYFLQVLHDFLFGKRYDFHTYFVEANKK